MVALAQDLPGLIGARLTGGGFGGCTVNLVEQPQAEAFAEALGGRYAAQFGIVARSTSATPRAERTEWVKSGLKDVVESQVHRLGNDGREGDAAKACRSSMFYGGKGLEASKQGLRYSLVQSVVVLPNEDRAGQLLPGSAFVGILSPRFSSPVGCVRDK